MSEKCSEEVKKKNQVLQDHYFISVLGCSKNNCDVALRNQIITSNLRIVGNADSTDPIVGHGRYLSSTSGSMPGKKEEKETKKENPYSRKFGRPADNHLLHVQPKEGYMSLKGYMRKISHHVVWQSCTVRRYKLLETGIWHGYC